MSPVRRVRTVKNQYRGINAHAHSYWQATQGWSVFHNVYITYIFEYLQPILRPLGLRADIEESFQVTIETGDIRRPKPDLSIYDPDPDLPRFTPSPSKTATAVGVLEREEVVEEVKIDVEAEVETAIKTGTIAEFFPDLMIESPYSALIIYPRDQSREPVAWLEVLSPTNKDGGYGTISYLEKRRQALQGGVIFIELDFLHETPPLFPIKKVADYTDPAADDASAYPYRISVSDPHPHFDAGEGTIYEFLTDTPIPVVKLPLLRDQSLNVDFGVPYQMAFERGFYGDTFDYVQFPHHFERYRLRDQIRIARRMVAILDAHQKGADLETLAPLIPSRLKSKEVLIVLQSLMDAATKSTETP